MSSSDIPPRALPLERAIASWYDSEPLARRLSAYAANPSPLLLRWGRRVLERREPLWRPSRGLVSAGSSARASCVRSSTTSALAAASSPSFCASSSSCRQPCSPPAACSSCRSSSTCVTRCCSSSLVALSSAVRSSTLSCRSAASSSRPNSYSLSLIRRLPRPSSRSAASCRSSSSSRCCASTSSASRRSSASVVLVLACSSSERFFSCGASWHAGRGVTAIPQCAPPSAMRRWRAPAAHDQRLRGFVQQHALGVVQLLGQLPRLPLVLLRVRRQTEPLALLLAHLCLHLPHLLVLFVQLRL
mmetsp:Transcript_4179/g.10487  ORF Transcript_4179/g.10487 Transcript_4179/m.10487 type:complete len:302 (-) Transcript_4179:294-1199(-)